MIYWGCHVDSVCMLCGVGVESCDHLFWDCIFTRQVWKKGKTLLATLIRLAWNCLNYYIWHERNSRLHGRRARVMIDIFILVRQDVRWRLSGYAKLFGSVVLWLLSGAYRV
ncbi:hypothetical protein GQ457_01G004850 [Hibiscus cannabinus]